MAEALATPDAAKPKVAYDDSLKKWTPEDERQIADWVEAYRDKLHLGSYEITLNFSAEERDDDKGCAADTHANFPYRSGNKINFYPKMLEWNAEQRRYRVIHELMHIILDPLFTICHQVIVKEQFVTWKTAKDILELVDDHLAVIVADLTA